MSINQHTRADIRARSRSQGSRRRRTTVWISILAAVILIGAVGAVVAVVGAKALSVKDSLTAAIPVAAGLPQKIVAGDTDATVTDAATLKELAAEAVTETKSRLWRISEIIPFLGQNLAAVRVAAESVDELADFAVAAAPSLNLAALRPEGGAVDMTVLNGLVDVVATGTSSLDGITADLDRVDAAMLIPEVSDALAKLSGEVTGASQILSTLSPILNVLPAALGEGGQRTYLLMFQGNSELRASGGNPAALALVTATDGRIELTTQATSVQFDNARPESIAPLDAETENLYSDIIGRWIPNMTATPDFPTTVNIMRAWWADEGLPPFDDVISIDPVALSHILKATGPIPLATGETLTSENAVSLLLNEVYFNYGEMVDDKIVDASAQDLFFASAAAQIFTTVTAGITNPVAFIDALGQSTEESRLKIWSSNLEIAALLSGTKLSGTLPASNDSRTVAGVYFNDTTGAKTDYYADASVVASTDQCTADAAPSFHQTVTFANNITPDQAATLPYFISGPHYPPGYIATDVVVYTPVGATIESWTVEGAESYTLVSAGTHLGRNVIRINVVTPPQTAATVNVEMKGAEGTVGSGYGAYDIWTTPMVRETPVIVEAPGCE